MKKIFIIANTAWYLYNFRVSLMKALAQKGYQPIAVAPRDAYADKIEAAGIVFIDVPMDNGGTNPVEDLKLFSRFVRLFRHERPVAVLTYTPKPNIYGALAARVSGTRVVCNVAGLGTVFISESLVTRIVKNLYRVALRRADKVFFQNNDDMSMFVDMKLVRQELAERLPGSGVDVQRFVPDEAAADSGKFVFLLVARMLWEKGVGQLVDATRQLKKRYPQVECQLLGFLDTDNPSAISSQQMQEWVDERVVRYLGVTEDVVPYMRAADCVVLPSYYREGVPRTLLEAASLGKPLITADSVGCKDVVDDGVNGFICRPKDASHLAEVMERMINLSAAERQEMGRNSRRKMLKEFDEQIVVRRYLDVVGELTG